VATVNGGMLTSMIKIIALMLAYFENFEIVTKKL